MNKWISVALMLLPVASMADEPQRPSLADFERHMRIMRTVMLADDLALEPAQALQVSNAMAAFDDRRHAALDQMRRADETLRQAADGDASAANLIDQAIQQRFDAQSQLQQTDREMLTAVSKGLTGQQKAKLAQFVTHAGGQPRPPPDFGPQSDGRGPFPKD